MGTSYNSLFIAGLGRLNFIHVYQLLRIHFQMLKSLHIVVQNVVKHLVDGYSLDSHVIIYMSQLRRLPVYLPVIAVTYVQLIKNLCRPLVCLC